MNEPDHEFFAAMLQYDEATGVLTWRVDRGGRSKAGSIAGSHHRDGYRHVKIARGTYMVHRVAWILHHRQPIPPGMQIDHRNNDRVDNRISNLRLASDNQNKHNRPVRRTNKAGFKGVSLHKASGLWVARIKKDKKIHELGYFKSPEEAHEAYKTAATRLHGEFARW